MTTPWSLIELRIVERKLDIFKPANRRKHSFCNTLKTSFPSGSLWMRRGKPLPPCSQREPQSTEVKEGFIELDSLPSTHASNKLVSTDSSFHTIHGPAGTIITGLNSLAQTAVKALQAFKKDISVYSPSIVLETVVSEGTNGKISISITELFISHN